MMRRIGTVGLGVRTGVQRRGAGEIPGLARSRLFVLLGNGNVYRPGGYCVSNRGIVEVCT